MGFILLRQIGGYDVHIARFAAAEVDCGPCGEAVVTAAPV
jgi:hypothetical protein